MKLSWSEDGWDDYLYWQNNNPDMVMKINAIVKDIRRSPFVGLGKPEALKAGLSRWWSRRITAEHRLVYTLTGKDDAQTIHIIMCRYHYTGVRGTGKH